MPNTMLKDVLRHILDTACLCLEDSLGGPPANCFLYLNEPPDDCCDLLAVWPRFIRPTRGFAENQIVSGVAMADNCCDTFPVVDLAIRLVRPCWPTVIADQTNPFPAAADMDAATAILFDDSMRLQCCVKGAFCGGLSIPGVGDCLEIAYGDMVPHGPSGGCAGWTWFLTVELPQCCDEA